MPGLVVDLDVGGDPFVADFEPAEIMGPVQVPPGDYEIRLRPVEGGDPILGAVSIPSGANVSVVAHLTSRATSC